MLPRAALDLLRSGRVGRLATVDARGRPHVVPVVFAYRAGVVYTPVDLKPKSVEPRRLQRVRNVLANPNVQLLVDRYDEDWRRLAYAQLRGRAALLEDGPEHARALRLLERKYPQYAGLPLAGRPVIRITIERVVVWPRRSTTKR
jgi:PPOX class probable F420-dependent enzyme